MRIVLLPFKYLLSFIRYFFIGSYYICTSKIMLFVLVVALGVGLFQVSTGLEEVRLKQEEDMYNEILDINYYYDEENDFSAYNENMGIDKLINCYKSGNDNIPDSVSGYVDRLNKLYNSSGKYFSFLYQDLFSGFTVSYNADSPIFTASTIKAPAMIYIYENASLGKIDLNEKMVYTSNYYHGGSGELQYKPFNTSYTIDELVQYTIHDSDNIAYKMLINKFGIKNVNSFWKEKGTKYIFESSSIWGYLSANDALIYMKELYKFSRENKEYGDKLLKYFMGAKWKMVTDKDGNMITANKGGWSNSTIHDIAIVFDKNPYILIILSNSGDINYTYFFSETNRLVGNMHEEYWKYKVNLCSNVELY